MFTGIVEEIGIVTSVYLLNNMANLLIKISSNLVKKLTLGASVAVNGVCLTIEKIDENIVSFFVGEETLNLTNLGELEENSLVNIESSMTPNKDFGGHIVQGHVANTTTILSVEEEGDYKYLKFKMIPDLFNYIVKKGYISIDGMSLTIVEENEDFFVVMLIRHTLNNTVAQGYQVGSVVNVEVDILGRYIEKMIKNRGI